MSKKSTLFNLVFRILVERYGLNTQSLVGSEELKTCELGAEGIRRWRYKNKPKPWHFHPVISAIENQLMQLKIRSLPDLDQRKKKLFDAVSPYIEDEELNIIFANADPIDLIIDLLTFAYEHSGYLKELDKDQPKAPEPKHKLDRDKVDKLREMGITDVETQEDLDEFMLSLSFSILETGDDDFAYWMLDCLYENTNYQEIIFRFASNLYDNNDYEKAYKIFNGLAEVEYDYALCILGTMHEHGNYVKRDLKKAFDFYLKAAQKGCTIAQTFVGDCYSYGKGVKKDIGKAYYWYLKVVDKKQEEGADDAQFGLVCCLREMYLEDPSEFIQQLLTNHVQKYAELGNAKVQYILACMYNQGIGVPRNQNLAIFWMREAAKLGLQDATNALADIEN